MINGETRIHGLYGFPIAHTMSPIIFNNAFQRMNINRTYVPFEVKPENLKDAVDAARVLGFEGFNVTMPHKISIVPLLDELENTASNTGSVNTVSRTSRGLVGHNTDGEGAARAIRAHGFEPVGQKILVIGAGATAQAIVQTLAHEADITVLSRDPHKADKIANAARGNGRVSSGPLSKPVFEESLATTNLLVDATPVQTASLIRSLSETEWKLPVGLWVFDLAYDQPLKSLPGVKRISPLEMLVQQAALSYEIWMREPAPFQLMRSTLVERVGGDWK